MAMHTNNVQLTLNVSFHVWKAPISSIIDRLFDAYCIGLSVFCIQGCKRRTMQGIIRSLWKEHIHKWPTITHLQWDVVSLYKYRCLGSDVYFALLYWLILRMMFLCTLSYKRRKRCMLVSLYWNDHADNQLTTHLESICKSSYEYLHGTLLCLVWKEGNK